MGSITLFRAGRILTMDRNRPSATHVAVRDGRILAVGDADCVARWGDDITHDDRLADSVLMPGFVEGHAHLMAGAMWSYAYVGYHDRIDPNGHLHKGMATLDEVIARLRECAADLPPDVPLIGWGFDPIFLPDERMKAKHLDQIGTDRPVAIVYSSFHMMCINSRTLEIVGYNRETNADGVLKTSDGTPTGELQTMAAMFPVMRRLGIDFRHHTQSPATIRTFGKICNRAGVTTVTDLLSEMADDDLDTFIDVTSAPDFPVRIVPAIDALSTPAEGIVQRAHALKARSTDKLRLGAVKVMTDGSIQAWTARVKWPHYLDGKPNGLWNAPPEVIRNLCETLHENGVQMHIHVNGDEASAIALDALEDAARKHPWSDSRHVLQHCQMMGPDQFRRAAALGICTNLFTNHIWYFGDQHVALTIGEDRAARMNAARSAIDAGVPVALHSDAPVTPMAPLFTAWCAVNRLTMSGRTLGPAQCITVDEALHAITLGAAYTLNLDAEIGSIETGKMADFTVLGADPTEVPPEILKDVPVLGTVSSGLVHML